MNLDYFYAAAARAGLLTSIQVGALTMQAAFRAPDETVLEGWALSRDYQITYPTAWISLQTGDTVQVAGVAYTVREVRALHDGSESRATLSRT